MKHPCGLPEIDRMIKREQEFRDEMIPHEKRFDGKKNVASLTTTHSPNDQPGEQEAERAALESTIEGLNQDLDAYETKLATAETNADEWMERWVQASGDVKRVKANLARVEKLVEKFRTTSCDPKDCEECSMWHEAADELAAALKGEGE